MESIPNRKSKILSSPEFIRGVALILSKDAHAQAWVEAFAAYGYEVPFEKVRPLIGMGGDQLIPTNI
ncbi:MAG: hypothetical protein EAZ86_21980 [Oscillatoriales cyanobacterium]|nr:MAG: hypothetical protein EAZ86_21980 [Oscillatoriales cyanobacterium]